MYELNEMEMLSQLIYDETEKASEGQSGKFFLSLILRVFGLSVIFATASLWVVLKFGTSFLSLGIIAGVSLGTVVLLNVVKKIFTSKCSKYSIISQMTKVIFKLSNKSKEINKLNYQVEMAKISNNAKALKKLECKREILYVKTKAYVKTCNNKMYLNECNANVKEENRKFSENMRNCLRKVENSLDCLIEGKPINLQDKNKVESKPKTNACINEACATAVKVGKPSDYIYLYEENETKTSRSFEK